MASDCGLKNLATWSPLQKKCKRPQPRLRIPVAGSLLHSIKFRSKGRVQSSKGSTMTVVYRASAACKYVHFTPRVHGIPTAFIPHMLQLTSKYKGSVLKSLHTYPPYGCSYFSFLLPVPQHLSLFTLFPFHPMPHTHINYCVLHYYLTLLCQMTVHPHVYIIYSSKKEPFTTLFVVNCLLM